VQGEAQGASTREKIAAMSCLECMAADSEDYRTQIGGAGGMRLISMCMRDRMCSDVVLISACSLLLALSRSVRNLRTYIGDEAELGGDLCRILRSNRSVQLKARLGAAVCNLCIDFSPVRSQLVANGVLPILIALLSPTKDVVSDCAGGLLGIVDRNGAGTGDFAGAASDGPGDELGEGEEGSVDGEKDQCWYEVRLNAIWGLRNLSYKSDTDFKERLLQQLGGMRLLGMLDPMRMAAAPGGWGGQEADMLAHTLGMARNLCHGTPCGARAVLLAVGGVGGGRGMPQLLEAMAGCLSDDAPSHIAVEAIGTLSNMAANCPEMRLAVGMHTVVLGRLCTALTSGQRGPRVLSEIGWCLVNLSPPKTQAENVASGQEEVCSAVEGGRIGAARPVDRPPGIRGIANERGLGGRVIGRGVGIVWGFGGVGGMGGGQGRAEGLAGQRPRGDSVAATDSNGWGGGWKGGGGWGGGGGGGGWRGTL